MQSLPNYESNKRAYHSLLGGFLIHLMIGTFNLWGNISVYITSYLRTISDDITIDDMNSTFPFMGLSMSLFTPFSLEIAFKIGLKKTLYVCSFLFSFFIFTSSF